MEGAPHHYWLYATSILCKQVPEGLSKAFQREILHIAVRLSHSVVVEEFEHSLRSITVEFYAERRYGKVFELQVVGWHIVVINTRFFCGNCHLVSNWRCRWLTILQHYVECLTSTSKNSFVQISLPGRFHKRIGVFSLYCTWRLHLLLFLSVSSLHTVTTTLNFLFRISLQRVSEAIRAGPGSNLILNHLQKQPMTKIHQ